MRSRMQFRIASPVPTTLCDLAEGERLLVTSFRRWVSGIAGRDERLLSMAWRELANALGPREARAALGGLSDLVFRLAGSARRSIHHHQSCCRLLGHDEWRIVSLVGACQRGAAAEARAIALRFVEEAAAESIIEAAQRLASALSAGGRRLPDRAADAARIERALAAMEAAPPPQAAVH